jgi:hypothetical protein
LLARPALDFAGEKVYRVDIGKIGRPALPGSLLVPPRLLLEPPLRPSDVSFFTLFNLEVVPIIFVID